MTGTEPGDATYWFDKGVALYEQERREQALDAFERAIDLDQSYAAPWAGKGTALCALGRYEQALGAYRRAIKLDQNDATIWNNKGHVLNTLGRHEQALDAYAAALARDPFFALCYYNRAHLYFHQLHSPREALADIQSALRIGPATARHWLLCACIAASLSLDVRAERAASAYFEAIQVLPEDDDGRTENAALLSGILEGDAAELLALLSALDKPLLLLECMLNAPRLFDDPLWLAALRRNEAPLQQWTTLCRALRFSLSGEAAGATPRRDDSLPAETLRDLGLALFIHGDRRWAMRYFAQWRKKAPEDPGALYFHSHCAVFVLGGLPDDPEEASLRRAAVEEARELLRRREREAGGIKDDYDSLHLALVLAWGDAEDRRTAERLLAARPESPACLVQLAAMAEEDGRPYAHMIEACFRLERETPGKAFLSLEARPRIRGLDVPAETWTDLPLRMAHCKRQAWLEEEWDAVLSAAKAESRPDEDALLPESWSAPEYPCFSREAVRDAVLIPLLLKKFAVKTRFSEAQELMFAKARPLAGDLLQRELDYHADQVRVKTQKPADVRSLVFRCYASGTLGFADSASYLYYIHAKSGGTAESLARWLRRALAAGAAEGLESAASFFLPFDFTGVFRLLSISGGVALGSVFDRFLPQEDFDKILKTAQGSESMADFRAKRRAAAE